MFPFINRECEIKCHAGTRILFCPQVLASNDEPASINIGESVPTLTSTTTDSTNTSSSTNTVQYRDTGVKLDVTPHITADKKVSIEIEQEISSISDNTIEGIDSPIIKENTIKTKLTIGDNETILLGGMIRNVSNNSSGGIPYLRHVPVISWLLSGVSKSQTKTEILIMVKVNVIDKKSDMQKLISKYKNAVKQFNTEPKTPVKKP